MAVMSRSPAVLFEIENPVLCPWMDEMVIVEVILTDVVMYRAGIYCM